MAPSTLAYTTPNALRETPSIIILAICLPLVAVPLLILRSIVIYRRRMLGNRNSNDQNILNVGITVDVSKIVDSPGPCRKDAQQEKQEQASPLVQHLDLQDIGSSSPSASLKQARHECPRSDSCQCSRHDLSRLLVTSSLETTPPFPLAVAFSSMDVGALSQSAVRFPRFSFVYDPSSSCLGYPTIPSLRTVSSSRVSIEPSDRLSDGTTSNDSFDTLIENPVTPTARSREMTLVIEEMCSQKLDRHLSCSASVHSNFLVAAAFVSPSGLSDNTGDSSPTFSPPLPLSSTSNGSPLFTPMVPPLSPLVLTSLSPLNLLSSLYSPPKVRNSSWKLDAQLIRMSPLPLVALSQSRS